MKSLSRADRRTFLRSGAVGAGALWVSSLQELSARRAFGEYSHGSSKRKGICGTQCVRSAITEARRDDGVEPPSAA